MSNVTTPSVHRYLDDLDRALRDLPRPRRREISRDIRDHIDAALADAPTQSPAVIATILDRLGTPAEIAEAARAELPPVRARIAARDIAAIVLLLIGGIVVPFLGWLVGLVLLWTSTAWRTKDKLIATLVVPGGLLAPALLGEVAAYTSASSTSPVSCGPAPMPSPSAPSGDVVQQCTTSAGTGAGSTLLIMLLLIITVGGPVFSTIWLIRHARRVA